MKLVATLLLVGAALVFLVTRSLEDSVTWLTPIRATAEAAMVGALADWFAVTALFRHPLRLPIPHTAIIPANKDRIGRVLGAFVQENFISPDLVAARVRDAAPARRIGAWLAEPDNAQQVGASVGTLLSDLPDVLDHEALSDAVRVAIIERIRRTPAAPILARGLEIALAEGYQNTVVDAVLRVIARYLDENRDELQLRLRQQLPWWIPGPVDDRISTRVLARAQELSADVAADPDHRLRRDIDGVLGDLVQRLRHDPQLIAQVEARKEQLLDHPQVQAWAGSVWADVRDRLVDAARRPDSQLRTRLGEALASAGARLRDDPHLQETVDALFVDAVAAVTTQHGERGGRVHRGHGRAVGSGGHGQPARAGGRPRPAVHPHQRHRRRGPGRTADLSRRQPVVTRGSYRTAPGSTAY
jgi:uncharacterized membrane-anchored protein YjiN (DUF445 family)